MPLTFVVGTGRCGSTLLSRVLREHPDVLCMSEFFGILRLAGASGCSGFPVGDLTGAELWDLLARPFPMLDAMVAAGLQTVEMIYPFGTGRFEPATGVSLISHFALPMLAADRTSCSANWPPRCRGLRSASRETLPFRLTQSRPRWGGRPAARARGRRPVPVGQRGRRELVGQLLDRQQLRDYARAHDQVRREGLLAGRGEHGGGYHASACPWIPEGDGHAGSQYVIDFYNDTDPGPGALFDGEHAFQQAKQLVNQNPTPPGTWYELPVNPNDTQAQVQECLNEPLFFWDVPGAPLPGIEVPPQTLAQLALAKMNVPQAGKMILSPRSGNSYSNLPTFSLVTLSFRPEIGPGGLPYVTDNAQLGDQGATVWVEATPLQLSTNDNSARLDTAGCGYLGSTEMVRNPRAVAHTGANGTADCGATFRQPGTWNITATLTWRACWAVGVQDGPPPADCNPVPGAALNAVNWARNVNIHEIQAANGGG